MKQLLTPETIDKIGIGGLRWIEQDPPLEAYEISPKLKVPITGLSPVILAIKSKSLACLRYLVERGTGKGLRETF